MSYDVDTSETGASICWRGDEVLSWNYTSNMKPPRWREAGGIAETTTSGRRTSAAAMGLTLPARRHARATRSSSALQTDFAAREERAALRDGLDGRARSRSP